MVDLFNLNNKCHGELVESSLDKLRMTGQW
jgi:hypothetical protein